MSETAPAPRTRGRQTGLDMVRSLLVVLAGVLVLVLLAPRPSEPVRQPVDVAATSERAVAAGAPASVPQLPPGWEATSARFSERGNDGVPTWHVGYLTPTQRFAGIEVARNVTPEWFDVQTADGARLGTRQVAGHAWEETLSGDGRRRSLVMEAGGVTTVVTGTASLDELALLAEAALEGAR